MHGGLLPDDADIDHIDRCRSNNLIENLRKVTRSENLANRGKLPNNTSGFKGVHWSKTQRNWQATISIEGRPVKLGGFLDIVKAAEAYCNASIEIHGKFADKDAIEVVRKIKEAS